MMRAMRALAIVLVVACGHAPPPKPAAAEQPVATIADIAGEWVSSDDMDWSYALALEPGGAIDLRVDRNKMGRCEQKGKVAATDAPKTFLVTYEKNECNRDYAGASLRMNVASFTGDSLTIVFGGYGSEERHVFTRAPEVSREVANKPRS
jgi:hypothetical protein